MVSGRLDSLCHGRPDRSTAGYYIT